MTGRLAALFAPIIKAAKLAAWPVGSIYMSLQATSPGYTVRWDVGTRR